MSIASLYLSVVLIYIKYHVQAKEFIAQELLAHLYAQGNTVTVLSSNVFPREYSIFS